MTKNRIGSLNKKLTSYVFVVALISASITALCYFIIEKERTQHKSAIRINQLLDTVEYSAAIACYTNNTEIANDVASGLIRNDIVHSVKIINDQTLNVEYSSSDSISTAHSIIRELHSPFDKERVIGKVEVITNRKFIANELLDSLLFNVSNSLVIILIITLILFFGVRNLLLTPLTNVSNTLHAIAAGKSNRISSINKNADDELGQLVFDINLLLEVLESKLDEERSLREKIEHIEKQIRSIFESTSAGLFLLDENGNLLTCNPTLISLSPNKQIKPEALVGTPFAELFFENPQEFKQILQKTKESKQLETLDIMLAAKNAEPLWAHCLVSSIIDNNGVSRFEGVVFDISDRIKAEDVIRDKAEKDELTGLLRRQTVEAKLSLLIREVAAHPLVVMMLDLDGFKAVNDTYGHLAGDEVLITVAERLKKITRMDDLISRLGGDEFLLVLRKCTPPDMEFSIAEKIIEALSQPVTLKNHVTVKIGVSVGISYCQNSETSAVDLTKSADEAMYHTKQNGKNGFSYKLNDNEFAAHFF